MSSIARVLPRPGHRTVSFINSKAPRLQLFAVRNAATMSGPPKHEMVYLKGTWRSSLLI